MFSPTASTGFSFVGILCEARRSGEAGDIAWWSVVKSSVYVCVMRGTGDAEGWWRLARDIE